MSRLSDIAKELLDADNKVKALSTELEDAKKAKEELAQKLAAEMQEQDLFEASIDGLNKKFILRKEKYASYLVDNKYKVFEALRELGLGDIIKEDINSKTFNATIKTLLEQTGNVLPDNLIDYVKIYEAPKIGIVKKG